MTFNPAQKRRRRLFLGCVGSLAIVTLVLYLWIGHTVLTAFRKGFFDQTPERTYTATQEGNLKAIYVALMGYHDSEGHLPSGAGWMDAIQPRLYAADLTPAEADKKLVDPSLNPSGLKSSGYGWAFNDIAGDKYKDDIKNPKTTLLVFSSSVPDRNAHGSPDALLPKKPRAGGNLGITVSGLIVHLNKRNAAAR